jgi:hypothetical protein
MATTRLPLWSDRIAGRSDKPFRLVPQFEKPITTVDLFLLQLRILRLKGDIRALKFSDGYFARFQPTDSEVGGWLVVPQTMSTEAFVERQMRLNQLRTDPSLNDSLLPRPVN